MFMRATALLCASLLSLGCVGAGDEEILEGTQQLVDSTEDASAFVTEVSDQIELGGSFAAAALPTAEEAALSLAERISQNHPACATATAAGTTVTVAWSCTKGQGAQAVAISGTTTIEVSSDAAASTLTFVGSTDGLSAGLVTVSAATTVVVDVATKTATIDRDVTVTKDGQTLTISLLGDATLDNTDPAARRLTINAERTVSFGGQVRTQTWTAVVFQEGVRLPLSGNIRVEGARGGSFDASFSNDGAGLVTVTVVLTNRRGQSETRIFVVDTANGDVVAPQ